ncbi:fumarylacetoacetate hydrolase family protein [Streptomyces sp. NPDC048161]|uniref:2-keto-4-pentenoate hydratase n=1 Tax=Streptomyces sp. NPDC048161 TaxID=3160985 RepID=UPI0033DB70E2
MAEPDLATTAPAGAPDAGRIDRAAGTLLDAERRRTAVRQLTEEWPDLDLPTAYAVQDAALRRRTADGARLVGVKLGLTSVAKQRSIGIDAPVTAWLTDAMRWPGDRPVPYGRLIQPRAEPELVLVLGERLRGPGVTAAAALAAVRGVRAGIEIIDSRYTGFRFSLPDVVADNASAALFVLGERELAPDAMDLVAEECRLEVDGEPVATATGADVLGSPAEALARAANELAARGLAVEAGSLVLTGGMTAAVPLLPGRPVTARFGRLGTVEVR